MAEGFYFARSDVSAERSRCVRFGVRLRCHLGGPRWRQQLVDPALLPAPGQLLQHVARVRPRIHVVEPAGSEDRIDDGRTPSALVRTGEEVVLAADSDLPEGSLARVVVDLEGAIFKEPRQGGPLIDRVGQRLAERALGCCRGDRLLDPLAQRVEDRSGPLRPKLFLLIWSETPGLGVSLDLVQFLDEGNGDRRPLVGLERVDEVAPCVREHPTSTTLDPGSENRRSYPL